MNSIKPSIDYLLKVWQENSPASRIGIVLLSVICVIAIGGVGYWSIQPSFVVLISDQDSNKVDRVVNALDGAGIQYQLSGAGGNVLVDKRSYAKARLLVRNQGVADAGSMSGASLGGAFGSPTERRNLARIQKQQSLAGTIQKMSAIDHADVHLNIPNKGPFERKTAKPSASVMLTLRQGEGLSEQQASSIASFVAFAVEDMKPEQVQITDKDGRSYNVPNENAHQINSQVEYLEEAERKLARKAEDQLLHFLGFGNASVKVALDLTFKNGSTTTTKYDPDGKVASEEDLETETTTKAGRELAASAGGAAGVASNLQRPGRGEEAMESKTENIRSTYLVPVTEETVSNTTPVRNFMSVSVLVNSETGVAKQEDGTLTPGLDDQVTAIVKNAVGFRAETDTISVEFLPFPSSEPETTIVAAPFNWTQLTTIIEKASLAIAAGLAVLLVFLLIRRIDSVPQTQSESSNGQLDRERMESINQLSNMIKENPEAFAQVIRAWAGAESVETANVTDSVPQRRAA